jgi:hypothetical protein
MAQDFAAQTTIRKKMAAANNRTSFKTNNQLVHVLIPGGSMRLETSMILPASI